MLISRLKRFSVLSLIYSAVLVGLLCHSSYARNTDFKFNFDYGTQVFVLKNPTLFLNDLDFTPTSIQTTKIENLTLEQAKNVLSSISEDKKDVETTLVTDNQDLVKTVERVESNSESKGKKKFDFLIHLDNFKSKVSAAYKQDKFGFWITIVTFGVDSYLWITASSMDTLNKVGLISFNFLLTASFGINKDLWANTTKPIQSQIYKLLSWLKLNNTQSNISNRKKDIAVKYASSFILGSAIQLARLAIFRGSELMSLSSAPWLLGATFAISSVLAFSQFGWDEHIAAVDKNKTPTAKFALRRFHELRGLLMTYLSSTSKLAQPDAFGAGPWIYSIVNGVAGIAAFLNTDKVVNMLEKLNTWWPGLKSQTMRPACVGFYL